MSTRVKCEDCVTKNCEIRGINKPMPCTDFTARVNKSSKMFPWINRTWNPLAGACLYNCDYCWAKNLIKRFIGNKKYVGEPRLVENEFRYLFKKTDFVFAQDMSDLFGYWVPSELIQRVVDYANGSPAQFLFLTKNPERYRDFVFGGNCVLGATIESDLEVDDISNAPPMGDRLSSMLKLTDFARRMVSVEPVMRFSDDFPARLIDIEPEFVACGFDNHDKGLPEPTLERVLWLIEQLEQAGIKVYRKTLR